MAKNKTLTVLSTEVKVKTIDQNDFICLTDIAKSKNLEHPDDLIRNWLRNRNTLELLGIWERLHNPDFNPVEFDGIRRQAGLNSFTLTPKQWTTATGAIGIESKAGRHGGTFAHRDIAFEFASWVSVEFKLYLIKEFQRMQELEQKQLGWNVKRNLTKINYSIHTDAIQTHLIPPALTGKQISLIQRSRCPEHGSFRDDGKRLASCEPQRKRKYTRRGERFATRLSGQSGKLERAIHQRGNATTGTAEKTQPYCD